LRLESERIRFGLLHVVLEFGRGRRGIEIGEVPAGKVAQLGGSGGVGRCEVDAGFMENSGHLLSLLLVGRSGSLLASAMVKMQAFLKTACSTLSAKFRWCPVSLGRA